MAIDLRAKSSCSLGPLISASISDSYIQGAGLVFCSGSCQVAGLVTPRAGTVVTFSYIKNGVTRAVPRKLRVLSSFANPFTKTTEVSLGCKLTYLGDLSSKTLLRPEDDPFNSEEDIEAAKKIVTVPIHAQTIADICLENLGIGSDGLVLTNEFSIDNFDFSNGYVNILSDLMLSENLCGYLDYNENLKVFPLPQNGGTGPVLTEQDIIEIGGINSGEAPGEKVIVSYSSLKLQIPEIDPNAEPDPEDPPAYSADWEEDVTIGFPTTIKLAAKLPDDTDWEDEYTYRPVQRTVTKYDEWDRVIERITTDESIRAATAGGYYTDGVTLNGAGWALEANRKSVRTTVTRTTYKVGFDSFGTPPEDYDQVASEITETTEPLVVVCSAAPIDLAFSSISRESAFPILGLDVTCEITRVTYEQGSRSAFVASRAEEKENRTSRKIGTIPVSKTVTESIKAFAYTSAGQQAIGKAIESGRTTNEIGTSTYTKLVSEGVSVNISAGREAILETRPSATDRILGPLADRDADPNNGYSVSASSESEFFYSEEYSGDLQRLVEFQMPYAPDDRFIRVGTIFRSIRSDAAEKANAFGRIQNRLLYANRNGINIQTAPERVPQNPYDPIIVRIDGFDALCRCNGTVWTLDAEGVIVGVDALLWGAVGRTSSGTTGTPWFSLPDGIEELETSPEVVDGEMVVPGVVPPWNEISILSSKTRSTMVVSSLPYGLELFTEPDPIVTKSIVIAEPMTLVRPEEVSIDFAIFVPQIITGYSTVVPRVNAILSGPAPTAGGGINVPTDFVGMSIQTFNPIVPRLSTDTTPLESSGLLVGVGPVISTGGGVVVPEVVIVVSTPTPSAVPGEPYWFFYYDQVFGWESIYMPDGWVN